VSGLRGRGSGRPLPWRPRVRCGRRSNCSRSCRGRRRAGRTPAPARAPRRRARGASALTARAPARLCSSVGAPEASLLEKQTSPAAGPAAPRATRRPLSATSAQRAAGRRNSAYSAAGAWVGTRGRPRRHRTGRPMITILHELTVGSMAPRGACHSPPCAISCSPAGQSGFRCGPGAPGGEPEIAKQPLKRQQSVKHRRWMLTSAHGACEVVRLRFPTDVSRIRIRPVTGQLRTRSPGARRVDDQLITMLGFSDQARMVLTTMLTRDPRGSVQCSMAHPTAAYRSPRYQTHQCT
jgi:hypothetical protein